MKTSCYLPFEIQIPLSFYCLTSLNSPLHGLLVLNTMLFIAVHALLLVHYVCGVQVQDGVPVRSVPGVLAEDGLLHWANGVLDVARKKLESED